MNHLTSTGGFRRFDVRKMNLIALISFKVAQEQSYSIIIDFEEFKQFVKVNFSDLEHSSYFKELTQMSWVSKKNERDIYIPVFMKYEVNMEENSLHFLINPNARIHLEELGAFFTIETLKNFLTIPSSYAKTAYFLFLEMQIHANYTIQIDSFKHILAIPSSYKMSDIDKKVLKPIKTQLKDYFPSLAIEKISAGKGRAIEYLRFQLFN